MQTVQFVARREVTILGKVYAPGDVVDDINIPSRVLSSLTNTRKIAQKIAPVLAQDEGASSKLNPEPDAALKPKKAIAEA